ncbi:MAG: RNA polymerase sigma factor [Bacteroidales bacterium]|nr:RNA polymerase sigma factor [Bacteroidales bacterium]
MDNLEQTFNEIVAKYRERLYWHIRSLVCSHEDADDVLQDCFVKIWKALPGFRGDSELFTWAWRIATNEALNFLHKQKVRAALSFESLRTTLENRIDEDPWFDGDALQRDLAKAIVSLPEKQRLVFQMRYYEDLSYEQISEITGTSVGALKASYHIAYEKIREILKLSSL